MNTITVPFHGNALYLINYNDEPYTPMKPIVEEMGMNWASQYTKLKQRFRKGIVQITIPSAGGTQEMTCLVLRKLDGWLQTISPNKVKPEIRDKVVQYQKARFLPIVYMRPKSGLESISLKSKNNQAVQKHSTAPCPVHINHEPFGIEP